MWMNHEGYGMGGYWLGWVGMAFFGLIMILLVWAVVKYLKNGRGSNAPDGGKKSDALGVLEERYAKGEINREAYLQMRDELKRA